MLCIRTFRRRRDQGLMIPEYALVAEIEIIVPDLCSRTERVVKCGIQMIILPADFYNVPRMAVFDPLLWAVSAQSNHAPNAKRIAKHLY